MFLQYYGLREQPFGTTPDPHLLYLSESHREALASLIYGIETGRGFMALIAEPGMGKTTLLFQLMERLRNAARTVFLFQTQGNTREFFSNLIADLGLDPGDRDVSSLQRELNEILIREAQMGRQFVLIVDEAQNLKDSVLESVRMLSNFETPRSKLLQIILAGQPALADKLARPEFEQLRQRVSVLCRLKPFTKEEVADYVRHRLEAAGYKGGRLFTADALSIIAEQSRGIPRNINNLCFHALSLGYAKSQVRIDPSIVREVLADLDLEPLRLEHSKLHNEVPQPPNAPFDLGDVTLDDSSHTGENRLYGGRHSFASSHGISERRRKPPKQRTSRWLIWAVILPAIILAAEMFWAYLPAGSSREVVTKSLSTTVREAKKIAVQHDFLKPSAPTGNEALTKRRHNVAGSSNEDPSQTQQDGSSEPADSTNSGPGRQSSALPSDKNVLDPGGNSKLSPTKLEPRITLQDSNRKAKHGSSREASGASADLEKARVVIESNINAGHITINGKSQPDWQTPHVFSLPVGTYRISVSKAGYSTWFRDVQVIKGSEKWVMANLDLPRGVIVIDTEPPGMQVFIDGKPYGPSEVETALVAGSHSYEVIPPTGHQPISGTFVLKPGAILTRKITVLPSGGEPEAEDHAGPSPWKREANAMIGGKDLEQEF